jgi:hypothetical protein
VKRIENCTVVQPLEMDDSATSNIEVDSVLDQLFIDGWKVAFETALHNRDGIWRVIRLERPADESEAENPDPNYIPF